MFNTKNNKAVDKNTKLRNSEEKTKMKLLKNISRYYDEMKHHRQKTIFQYEEEPFAENAQDMGKIMRKVSKFLHFLQTKPHTKIIKKNYFALYCTVIKKLTGDGGEN